MTKIKVMTIMGTRPEVIRLSEIMRKLDLYTNHIMVHTNQNYDYTLKQVFFDELNIRRPDHVLDVRADTIGEQYSHIFVQCEKVMIQEKPDVVLILGDTNSALSCIIAKRLKIVVFHAEAGNRCFDDRVPEEINRRIIDHTSDINLCYTEHARRNLLREGLETRNIFVVGSPLPEVYSTHRKNIEASKILETLKLEKDKYFLASIHREENVDNEANLLSIMNTLYTLGEEYQIPVILSTHPRTRKQLDHLYNFNYGRIVVYSPFGMLNYIKLQKNAFCNISDSGTIHEDAAILGIPAINIRESNERPEVYDSGNVIMTGVDQNAILNAVAMTRRQVDAGVKFANPYGTETNFSDKVVRLILSLTKTVRKRVYHETET